MRETAVIQFLQDLDMLLHRVLPQLTHIAEHHDLAIRLQEGEIVQGGRH